MKEASFGGSFANKIEKSIGGRVCKLADKATLGLPDNFHVFNGITTFFETKIGAVANLKQVEDRIYCRPWSSVTDIRQYEMCKRIGMHATVLYVIYYPNVRMTCVLPVESLVLFQGNTEYPKGLWLIEGDNFVQGHGVDVYERILTDRREKLGTKLTENAHRVS